MGCLGEGGMGRVYKAFDPVLKRPVALKFLRREDPELQRRLICEAQAQARIRHPHVCEIYEVGEFQNHGYIAMQFIEGKNLLEIGETLTQEQKANIVREVAEALHAAHRLGLIHRDVKPANILIETKEDGTLHPYILDFGLVREMEVPGHTVTGVVVGTPFYMAPEQARGEAGKIDRRSDVYSLGATLYEVLCGSSPFEGNTGVDIILKVLQEEPQFLRQRNSSISPDLESIVMKCLEKEPERRYDSARAFAEDLERFLDAEPVLARRAGFSYRLNKKIRKNKAIFAVSGASLVLILIFAILGLRIRFNAAQQARLAQQFGQEIEKMDSTMRYAYLLPLHDIRMEKQMVKQRMRAIEMQTKQMGKVAKGPGEYALGRGWMSLHEYEKARKHLETAWQENYRAPEVAYSLGHTLGVLYHKELENVERITSLEMRIFQRKHIEKEYRDRAIQFVNESGGAWAESPSYVRGKIAFYQKRYEEALRRAHEAWVLVPWMYEAKLLEGEIWKAIGNGLRDRGDTASALAHYDKAEVAYREAVAKAASDNTIYEALCGLSVDRMNLQLYQSGESVESDFQEGLQVCHDAIKTNPESEVAFNNLSNLHLRRGEFQMLHGGDPLPDWKLADEFAGKELQWNPTSVNGYTNKGRTYRLLADYEMEHGTNPVPHLDKAIESFQNSKKLDPGNIFTYHNMGNVYWTLAEYQANRGLDPRSTLSQAFHHYLKVISLNPTYMYAHHNLGVAYWTQAEYENNHGKDPRPSLEKASRCFQKSLELNPDYTLAYNNLGGVTQGLGEYQIAIGIDPTATLQKSIEYFQKAIQINAEYSYAYSNLVEVYRGLAVFTLSQGKDPSFYLNQGKPFVRRAVDSNPDFFEPYLMSARLNLVEAQFAISQNASPLGALKEAEESLQSALRMNPEEAEIYNAAAEMYQLLASWKIRKRKSADVEIQKGLEAVNKALQYHPHMSRALATRAGLGLLLARADTKFARDAHADLLQALHTNANLKRQYTPLLRDIEKLLVVAEHLPLK